MSIFQFPAEIWHHILASACTDGGSTGCALSLVSHYIRECSKPFKLHSVALHGTRQTLAFVAVFVHTPTSMYPIKHLFISNIPSKPVTWTMLASTVVSSLSLFPPRAATPSHSLDGDIQMTHALILILEKTSSTLQTLAIGFAYNYGPLSASRPPPMDAPMDLPALTELSIAYEEPDGIISPDYILPMPFEYVCPALRRLDIGGLVLRPVTSTTQLCARLNEVAPRLTHLRICARMAPVFLRAMPPREGVSSETSSIHQQVQHLPSMIRRVLIQPNDRKSYMCLAPYASLSHPCPCPQCEILAKAAADDRIIILEAQGDKDGQLETAWLERVDGGEGCWDECWAVSGL